LRAPQFHSETPHAFWVEALSQCDLGALRIATAILCVALAGALAAMGLL
jgi:hypothetical protein